MINSGREWDWIQELYLKEQLNQKNYYYENNYQVMTKKHHLERGYCCKNNCRHCPYER